MSNIIADNSPWIRLWWSTAELWRASLGPVTLHRHTAGHWRHWSVCLWPGYIRRQNNRFSQHFFLIVSKGSMSAYSLLLSLSLTHTHTHKNKQNKHTHTQKQTKQTHNITNTHASNSPLLYISVCVTCKHVKYNS